MKIIDFLKHNLKNYVFIALGLLLYTFAWSAFLIPQHLTGGGVTGTATLIYYATGLPTGFSILIINALFILGAIKIIDLKFALNSIFGFGLCSIFFLMFEGKFPQPLVEDQFMCVLITAGLSALGTAIAFINGGNSGGVDILALIITRYKNISPGKVILYHDMIVIACAFWVLKDIEKVVYGYVLMFAFSYVLDMILEGQRQSYQITIFSHQSQQIADRISAETGRGVTLIKAQGHYSQQPIDVIIVIAHRNDKKPIMRIIHETDKNAFLSVAKVSSVYGQNFDKIKL